MVKQNQSVVRKKINRNKKRVSKGGVRVVCVLLQMEIMKAKKGEKPRKPNLKKKKKVYLDGAVDATLERDQASKL